MRGSVASNCIVTASAGNVSASEGVSEHPAVQDGATSCRLKPGLRAAHRTTSALIATALLLALSVSAQTTNRPAAAVAKPARPEFSAFKLINERNIFNPHRSGRYTERRESPRTLRRADSIALAGTMIYEKGPFAFFEGSSSDFTKVAKPGDTIATYTISDIQPSGVKLTSGTNVVELPVGMQLRREESGPWLVSARPEPVYVSRGERTEFRRGTGNGAGPGATPAQLPDQIMLNLPGAPGASGDQPPVIILNGDAISLSPDGVPQGSFVIPSLQQLTAPPDAGSPAAGGAEDVLTRLRQRAAAERGDRP